MFQLLEQALRKIPRDTRSRKAYLKKDKHEDRVGTKANKSRRPTLQQKLWAFVPERGFQYI